MSVGGYSLVRPTKDRYSDTVLVDLDEKRAIQLKPIPRQVANQQLLFVPEKSQRNKDGSYEPRGKLYCFGGSLASEGFTYIFNERRWKKMPQLYEFSYEKQFLNNSCITLAQGRFLMTFMMTQIAWFDTDGEVWRSVRLNVDLHSQAGLMITKDQRSYSTDLQAIVWDF